MSALEFESLSIFDVHNRIQRRKIPEKRRIVIEGYMGEAIKVVQLSVDEAEEILAARRKKIENYKTTKTKLDIIKRKFTEKAEDKKCLEIKNVELRTTIDENIREKGSLLTRKNEAEFKKEEMKSEIKKTHETFLKAITYYKRKLEIQVKVAENGNIFVHFFNMSPQPCKIGSVTLSCNNKWSLCEMDPSLPCMRELANKLDTSQNIQSFLSCVRNLFIEFADFKKA